MQKYIASQNDVIHKLAGNIDILTTEIKRMTAEMKQIKVENKELRKICSELRDKNKTAKSKMPMANARTQSYANVAKNALIVKAADKSSITEKRVKIARALADAPIDRKRETTNGALVMNFKSKANMEKPKKVTDDDNIETIIKVGNTYVLKIKLTYMSLLNEDEDEDDDDDDDGRERFKEKIIEGLKRKNEFLKNVMQNDDDLKVILVRKANRNQKQKHVTLKCSPHTRKVINDKADQLYLESQVYDTYRVMIRHHCQKYGHIAEKWPEKKWK